MYRHLAPHLSLLVCGFAAACASGSHLADAPVQVDALVTSIERVHIEAERSRVAVADAFTRLQSLGSGQQAGEGLVGAYAQLVQAIDAAEEQTGRFGAAVDSMQGAASPVFEQWNADLGTIASDRLRKRSELRLAVTRERYDAIVAAAVPARHQFDGFVRTLRDHATFLAHDLNASALDDLRDEVRLVADNTRNLDRDLERTLGAARAYVESAALPAGAATPGR